MPQNIFNLYSAVAFADHPLATWPLDDDFSFISLIGASPVWTVTNGSSANFINKPTEKPQETVGIADVGITTYDFIGSASPTTIKSQPFSSSSTDSQKPTVCINTFIYTYGSNISSIEIGFESASVTTYSTYTNLAQNDWTRISHTASVSNSSAIYPYIKIYSGSASVSLYNFSVGQWSESANHLTTGSIPSSFQSLSSSATLAEAWGSQFSASPTMYKVYPIDSYGFVVEDGYYIVENNRMLAGNSNLPIIYGSGDVTNIQASQYGAPSIVFPGKGFLHDNGKYDTLTAEFWLKIAPLSTTEKKIFGPVGSDDGIYISQNFITINVGPYIKSYFVGKWNRPMLIHMSYSQEEISLMINGSQVINQKIDIEDIEFPYEENDWVAFYSDSSIKLFQIDSFSIYPYQITSNMAKRKFVYGQGVDNINDIVKKFNGSPTLIDFAFSNYSRNIIYPDNTPWTSGFYSNLEPQDKYLGFADYSTPELVSYGEDLTGFVRNREIRSWQGVLSYTWNYWKSFLWQKLSMSREMQLLFDNYQNQSVSSDRVYFSLRPTSSYHNIYSSIVFKDANPINDNVKSILGVFSINRSELDTAISALELNQSEIIIMQFKNTSNDLFKIIASNIVTTSSSATFKLKYYINSYQINTSLEETIVVDSSSSIYNNTYFVAGIDTDKISLYASSRLRNYFKNMNNLELSVGGTNQNQFSGRIYRVIFNNAFFTLNDMSTYFDSNGFAKKSTSCVISSADSIFDYIGNYTLLFKKANNSIIMDIGVAGYWQGSIPLYQLGSYITKSNGTDQLDLDMIQFNINMPTGFTNSDNHDISDVFDAYVTIQRYQDIGTIPYSTYTEIQSLNSERYVDFDEFSKVVLDVRKFKVSNGTIIFPPKNVIDFKNTYLTFHIELKSNGIATNNFQLQNMSIASLAFDNSNLFSIGTGNGNQIYPFTRESVTYAPKLKNPFLIYKESTPYLYLTGDSGIQVLPYSEIDDTSLVRGISVPINLNRKAGYQLYGFSLWMMYNDNYTFTERNKIFSIYTNDEEIFFYVEPEYGNKRSMVSSYLKNISGESVYTNAVFHQNGIKQIPYIEPLKWSMITVEFSSPIDLNSINGQIELYPGCVFNNITIYDNSISNIVDDIFESHLGLSNIVSQDETILSIDSDALDFYYDVKWTNFTGKPL